VQTVTLPHGRTLAYEEVGDPGGLPVVYHHGGLRCRLDALALDDAARATGVRLVAPDRPGIGGSTRAPGRRLDAWPADVAGLADALGIGRFAVFGWSLGGPHALACAAVLGERVTAAATLGCPIPADWPGMRDQINGLDRRLMRGGAGARMVLRGMALSARRLPGRTAQATARALDERSAAVVLAQPQAWAAGQAEGLADLGGVQDDYAVMAAPWELDLAAIAVPVRLWQGSADTLVPAPWVVRLAEALAHAQIGALEGEGHVLAPARYEDILASLSAVARNPS
jgi:pimeloyl-ACP methyl ester carboxylesterase